MKKNSKIIIFSLSFIFILSGIFFVKQQTKQKRVYVDMVADLFHCGHVEFFKKAKQHGNYLIVGIHSDQDCSGYKRKPILTLEERVRSVQACRYVDEVIPKAPLIITDELIDKNKIDVVVHGDDFDKEKIKKYYHVPLKRKIFKTVPYTKGISTTDILNRIKEKMASI
ncbi:MAG: adenylyltransferase/cytidyltransferase family protein [bacterium]